LVQSVPSARNSSELRSHVAAVALGTVWRVGVAEGFFCARVVAVAEGRTAVRVAVERTVVAVAEGRTAVRVAVGRTVVAVAEARRVGVRVGVAVRTQSRRASSATSSALKQ
jgi:hypothetical protein